MNNIIFKYYPILLILCCFGLYSNSLSNKFVLDDGMVLTDNVVVKKGITNFIEIVSNDLYYGIKETNLKSSGGRWRPLSLVLLSLEYSLFGLNPFFFHLINILLYSFTALVLYLVLKEIIFKGQHSVAFLTTLIFIFHPIHTEVVSNIKSMDEILSLLLLLSTWYFTFKFINTKYKYYLLFAILTYGLALLSKENGLVFLFILPISFYFFSNLKTRQIIKISLPFIFIAILYSLIRFGYFYSEKASSGIMDDPYLYASKIELLSTKIFVLGNYLKLILLPYPLSYDYSFNQIPYVTFNNIFVWGSVVIHLFLIIISIIKFKKKSLVSFAILFYLASIFMVSNLIIDIGLIMGERLLFQASIGFSIIIGYLYLQLYQYKKPVLIIIGFIGIIMSVVVVNRNKEWKTNKTLFLSDVKKVPNSARANYNAGTVLMIEATKELGVKQDYSRKLALEYFSKTITIDSTNLSSYINSGNISLKLGQLEGAEYFWNKASRLDNNTKRKEQYKFALATEFHKKGLNEAQQNNNFSKAITYFDKAVKYQTNNEALYGNQGNCYMLLKEYDKALVSYNKALTIDPTYNIALEGLNKVKPFIKNHP